MFDNNTPAPLIRQGPSMKQETRAVRMRRLRRPAGGATLGRPRKLTREAIIEAATALLDEGGSLTLRSLASRLDVQASTIYTYFDDVTRVEDAVIESLLAGVPMPDAAAPQPLRTQIVEHYLALRAVLIQHRGA